MKKGQIAEKKWVIGDSSYYDFARDMLSHQSDTHDLRPSYTAIDISTMSVSTFAIEDEDLNGDGFKDVLMVNIFSFDGNSSSSNNNWHAFIAGKFGSKAKPIEFSSFDDMVTKSDFVIAKQTMNAPSDSDLIHWASEQIQSDIGRDVAQTAHDVLSYCYGSLGFFGLVVLTDKQREQEATDLYEIARSSCAQSLAFAIPFVETVASFTTDRDYASRLLNSAREMKRYNAIPTQDYEYIDNRLSLARNIHRASYDGDSLLSCDQLQTRHNAEHEEYTTEQYLQDEIRQKKLIQRAADRSLFGLFDDSPMGFISIANQTAVSAGFSNYADYRLRFLYDVSLAEYKETALRVLDNDRWRIENAIRSIKSITGEPAINEENIWTLLQQKMRLRLRREAGVDNVPHLSFSQAMDVTRAFLKDLGLSLDDCNYGSEIIYDIQARNGKNAGQMSPLEDGRKAWISIQPSANDRITLAMLKNLIHETVHAIHYRMGASDSGGSALAGTMMCSKSWVESLAMTVDSTVPTVQFIERYLSKYDGFNNPLSNSIIANETLEQDTFVRATVIVLTLWEVGLYEDSVPDEGSVSLDDRLNSWGSMSMKHLGFDFIYDPMPGSSELTAQILDSMFSSPLHYAAYVIGGELIDNTSADLASSLFWSSGAETNNIFAEFRNAMNAGGNVFSMKDANAIISR